MPFPGQTSDPTPPSGITSAEPDTSAPDNSQPDKSDATADQPTQEPDTPWNLILVNRWHPLPEGYQPQLMTLSNGKEVDERIYPSLQKMFDQARSEGVYPIVASAYRTAEKQQSIMDEKIAEYQANGYSAEKAKTEAEKWVAIPGTSEHQLGLAVDINADGIHSAGYEVYDGWTSTPTSTGSFAASPSPRRTSRGWPTSLGTTGMWGRRWRLKFMIEASVSKNI